MAIVGHDGCLPPSYPTAGPRGSCHHLRVMRSPCWDDRRVAPALSPCAPCSAQTSLLPTPVGGSIALIRALAGGIAHRPGRIIPMTDPSTSFPLCVERLRAGQPLDGIVDALLDALSPGERLGLLDGDLPFWDGLFEMNAHGYNRTPIPMGRVERLGIPGLLFSDGPRGVVMGHSTAFPVSMARGATWDPGLEEQVGAVIGLEGRALGANFFGGVCINLPRHPAWGRVQETYGEDPLLLGEMGAALVRGVQPNMMAVAKHYALNSMENARFTVDVTADGATLHEVFLAHFRRVVDEGVDGIMTSYNSVNGEWAGESEVLLEGVLRGQWGFDGVTVSDFVWGLRDAAKSLRAGLDVEEPFAQQRARYLPEAIRSGAVTDEHIARAARRILGTQLRYYARRSHADPSPSVVFSAGHRALAREVAGRAMVLLKNEPVNGQPLLPLEVGALGRIAVIGRLADVANTGDHGSSDVRSPAVVTLLEGLRAALPGVEIGHSSGDDPALAAEVARVANVAVVVVGYTAEDEGEYIDSEAFADPALLALFPPLGDNPAMQQRLEGLSSGGEGSAAGSGGAGGGTGGDRLSLRLRPVDAEIIRAVAAANARTVVAIVTGGAVITEEWRDVVPAVLLQLVLRVRKAAMPWPTCSSVRSTRQDGCPSRYRRPRTICRSSIARPPRSPMTSGSGNACSTGTVTRRRSRSGSGCPTRTLRSPT